MQFFYLMSHLHERIRSIQYTFSNPSILLLLSTMSHVIYLPFLIKRSSIFHPLSNFFFFSVWLAVPASLLLLLHLLWPVLQD